MEKAKILFIDIENTPLQSFTWGRYEQDVVDVKQESYILSIAYKWLGEKKTNVLALNDFKGYKPNVPNDKNLMIAIHKLLSEADIIVGQNCDAFDIKKINTRFIYYGLKPVSPYKTVDTLKAARKKFSFSSNKLNDLGKFLGLGEKKETHGFRTWLGCMNGDKKSWSIMKEYNCLTPDHKVLTTNLKWKEIGKLDIGETILGFDENLKNSNGTGRRLRKTTILGNRKVLEDVYEVSLSNGDKIKCTKDHKWLCSPYTSSRIKSNPRGCYGGSNWKTTEQLIVDGKYLNGKKAPGISKNTSSVVFKYFNIEEEINSKDAGWISGMFDGEGSLSNRKKPQKGEVGGFQISISQKIGKELDKIKDILKNYNINFSINVHEKNYHAIKSNNKIKSSKPIGYITIAGKFPLKIEFLQKFRPERLINNINFNNLPRLEGRNIRVIVKDIKYLGKKEVIILETDTKTYFADGYAMHNCQDVILLEKIYLRLLPWISNHPTMGMYNGKPISCPNCGSDHLQSRGTLINKTARYRRFQCQDCAAWSKAVDKEKQDKKPLVGI